MGCRLPLVVVRFAVVAAHRVVLEAVPHQDAAQVGVAFKDDAEEVVHFAFLEFRAAPDRRQRGQRHGVGAVAGDQPQHHGSVAERDRIKVIHDLEASGFDPPGLFLDHAGGSAGGVGHGGPGHINHFLLRPVDPGHVGALVQLQRGIITQERGDGPGMRRVQPQGVLRGGRRICNQHHVRRRKEGGDAIAQLGEGFHGGSGLGGPHQFRRLRP